MNAEPQISTEDNEKTHTVEFSERELEILQNLVLNEHNDLYNREGRSCETKEGRDYIATLQTLADLFYRTLGRVGRRGL
jgi:hypothetical protein